MKRWVFLLVLGAAIVIRICYIAYSPMYITTGDTVSYYLTAKKFIAEKTFVDQWRTPAYPLVLASPFLLRGKALPNEIFGVYIPELYVIRLAQAGLGVCTALLIYFFSLHIGMSPGFAAIVSIFATSDVFLLRLEKALLTETIALVWLYISLFIMDRLIRSFRIVPFLGFVTFWLLGVSIRPSVVFIPIIACTVLIFWHRNKRVLIACFLGMCLFVGGLYQYAKLNEARDGYFGISRISDVNMWGVLLASGVPPHTFPDTEIGRMATVSYEPNERDPWEIFRRNPVLFDSSYASPFHKFTQSMVVTQFGRYLRYVVSVIGSVVVYSTGVVVPESASTPYGALFRFIDALYVKLAYMSFVPLIIFPLYLWIGSKKKSKRVYLIFYIMMVGWYQVLLTASMTYDDFGRHMIFVRGILFIATGSLLFRLVKDLSLFRLMRPVQKKDHV